MNECNTIIVSRDIGKNYFIAFSIIKQIIDKGNHFNVLFEEWIEIKDGLIKAEKMFKEVFIGLKDWMKEIIN